MRPAHRRDIARDGLEASTIRSVAKESGSSAEPACASLSEEGLDRRADGDHRE